MAQQIGILGSDVVGIAPANGFVKNGYDVMLGTNTPAKYSELKKKTNDNAKLGSFMETAEFGEIVILAVKGVVAERVVTSVGNLLNGKIVIDATNPIAEVPPTNGVLHYFTEMNRSLMERLQQLAPTAHFVKAFSCVGNAFMIDPNFNGLKPTMFISGNNSEARREFWQFLHNSVGKVRIWVWQKLLGQ